MKNARCGTYPLSVKTTSTHKRGKAFPLGSAVRFAPVFTIPHSSGGLNTNIYQNRFQNHSAR